MKKLLLLLFVTFCLSSFLKAAETKLFTGDTSTSLFSRMDIISWAMGETKDGGRYVNFGTDAAPAFTEVGDNPVKTGINKSDKALHMSALKGNSWWPNFMVMNLIDPLTITEGTRYLHIYHYRENLNKGFSVYLTDGTLPEDADKGTKRFDMNLKQAGTWEDVVVDLKWFIDNNQPLTAVSFLVDMNWGGDAEPATNYYFDEIVLNDSNLPRGITLLTDKEISIFPGNADSYSKGVSALDLQNSENTSEIVANPFTTETAVLNSENVMKFNKSANAAWWQGPRFSLNGTMPVGVGGVSNYLHVMVNIPEMEAGKDYYVVQLNAKDFSGKQLDSGDAIKYWAEDKGKWIDCVFDVTSLGYVSEFTVRFDVRRDDKDAYVNSPAGTFYLDAFAINESADQRAEVKAPVTVKETKLFTGDVTPSLFARMDIIDWAMGETKDGGRYVNFGTDAAPAFTEVGTNPDKTGLNKSDKALHMSALKGNSWWPNFLIMKLTDGVTVTQETRYLHIYHYRENLNKGFSVYLTDGTLPEDADKGTKRFDMNLKKAATWEDVVVDLKWFIDNNQPLTAVSFLVDMNWGGDAEPATNYYFDEIVLNNSNLPRGIKLYTEKEIAINLGNDNSVSKYVENIDLQNSENTSEIVTNPFTSQSTAAPFDKIMKFSKSANASWWQGGPRFALNGTLPVGTNGTSSYLHVFVNIPEMSADKDYYVVQLNAKDFTGKQIDSGDALKYWADDKGKWIDMVMDVTSLGYVSEFQVRFDVRRDDKDAYINSPAGVFYLDALEINGNADARTMIATGIPTLNNDYTKIYSSNRNILVEGNVSYIEVYNLLGSLVKKVPANGLRTEIPVAKTGVYLVRTLSSSSNVFTSKVMVN